MVAQTSLLGASRFGALGLVFMLVFFAGTFVSWWATGVIKWESFLQRPYGPQAQMLRFILSLLGGFLIALIATGYVIALQLFESAL